MSDLSPLEMFQNAGLAAKAGRRDEALSLADRYAAAAAGALLETIGRTGEPDVTSLGSTAFVDALDPAGSLMFLVAPGQTLFMRMQEWNLAALKGADVCALAEHLAPNTAATAGDYTQLAEALEQQGDPEKALEATEAAIRHLKGDGSWGKYAKAYTERAERLKRQCGQVGLPSEGPAEVFWRDVRSLCVTHVQRMIRYFDSHGAARMDFARPRLAELVENGQVDATITAARKLLSEYPDGLVMPRPIAISGSWFVVLSVFPSANDRDFLAACPGGSFVELAQQARAMFRTLDNWASFDFAHWILAVGKQSAASVHLHTHWSFSAHLEWLKRGSEANPVAMAPMIMPESLLKEGAMTLHKVLLMGDAAEMKRRQAKK